MQTRHKYASSGARKHHFVPLAWLPRKNDYPSLAGRRVNISPKGVIAMRQKWISASALLIAIAVPSVVRGQVPVTAPATPSSHWTRDSVVSKMDDSKIYSIQVGITEDKSMLTFDIQCSAGRKDRSPTPFVALSSSRVVDATSSGGRRFVDLRLRVDQSAPNSETWTVSDDFHAMFHTSITDASWQDSVAKARELRVEVPIYRAGRTVFTFPLIGMAGELAWLRDRCGAK